MASKQKRSNPANDEWVVVGEYGLDIDADLAVSVLEGNGIPAVRFPLMGQVASYFALLESTRVLVPAERAEEARELLR